jgi:nucleotide-binding universal stress UspA family protein
MRDRPVLVGIDPARPDLGALDLAESLARLLGARVVVAAVHPPFGATEHAERAAAVAAQRCMTVRAEALPVAASSPARGLATTAQEIGAQVLVVGAAHHLAGVSARVLNGAPCAVAVAPRRYAARAVERIGVAFCDAPEGRDALRVGVAVAAAAGARLRPISVIDPVAWTAERWPDLITPDRIARYRDGELRHLQAAADETCGSGAVRVEVLEGRVEALEEATADLDLVICGSRGYGPARVVLLGSVSHALAFHARCPVLILPRGSAAELVDAFGTASTAHREEIR